MVPNTQYPFYNDCQNTLYSNVITDLLSIQSVTNIQSCKNSMGMPMMRDNKTNSPVQVLFALIAYT